MGRCRKTIRFVVNRCKMIFFCVWVSVVVYKTLTMEYVTKNIILSLRLKIIRLLKMINSWLKLL